MIKQSIRESLIVYSPRCPLCGSDMDLRNGKFGDFFGCAKYPSCRGVVNFRNLKAKATQTESKKGLSELLKADQINGKKVVVTGEIEGYTREEIYDYIASCGGAVKSSVSSLTDLLIVGDNPGSTKLNAAQERHIKIYEIEQSDEIESDLFIVDDRKGNLAQRSGVAVLVHYFGNDKNVVVPEGVTGLGDEVFERIRDSLLSIDLPDSIEELNENNFTGCSKLNQVKLPKRLRKLDGFKYCTSLTQIEIPDSVEEIGSGAFSECTALAEIHFPKSLKKLGGFSGCTALTQLDIPDSVTAIVGSAFDYCTGLTKIKFPKFLRTLSGFSNCNALARLDLPDSIGEIQGDSFAGCTALTEVKLPRTLVKLEGFSHCTSLTQIEIPDTVIEIGKYSFAGCTALADVKLPSSLRMLDGFNDCTSITHIDIPDLVWKMGDETFSGCTALTYAKLPKQLRTITGFQGCTSLTQVEMPDTILEIGYGAFQGCEHLNPIRIPYYDKEKYTDYSFSTKHYKESYLITFPNPRNAKELVEIPLPFGVVLHGLKINDVMREFDATYDVLSTEHRALVELFRVRSDFALDERTKKKYLSDITRNINIVIGDLIKREGPTSLTLLVDLGILNEKNIEKVMNQFMASGDVEIRSVLLNIKMTMMESYSEHAKFEL